MPTREQQYQRVVGALQAAQRVCIITHLRPDADAVGSATALSHGLRQLGKETGMYIGQLREISSNLMSIPGADEIRCVRDLPEGYDLYVTVDCGSLDRTGLFSEDLEGRADFMCIDHHSSNPGFADINLVATECESTTVALTKILDLLGVEMNRDIAYCLYAGLVTDTGCFRWGRPVMHDYARRYMQFGLDTKQIAVDLIDSTTAEDLQMVGRVLAGLRIITAGSHTMAVLVASLHLTEGASEAAVESLVDFVRALEGTDMGVTFKEQVPGVWAASLRSSTVDCAEVAMHLDGGGHVPAAGYTTHGDVGEIINELVEVVGRI
ncbi:bifunctional oligoribonuclease/PAP phosphatase NrnA [uncultured Corynebacterium sp.]|uniref:DHH family phosphoesterase n=1 Tax=uncultured Corynebacterium sp. TaxID=159447 RepID=UPI0025D1A84D|nr:bifunctional oligoribonuclease/PAP phosphatase NrnA [uncultured Corynebacterium sp.]